MKEVHGSVSNYIYSKAARHLQSEQAQQNFMLHFNLSGNFGNLLPHYMRKENYDTIKANINQLTIIEGYTGKAIHYHGKFRYMNLSNIFEYMNKDLFAATAHELIKGTDKDGKLAYWNLMVERSISKVFLEKVTYQKELSLQLSEKDKGFYYNQFIIDTINE